MWERRFGLKKLKRGDLKYRRWKEEFGLEKVSGGGSGWGKAREREFKVRWRVENFMGWLISLYVAGFHFSIISSGLKYRERKVKIQFIGL